MQNFENFSVLLTSLESISFFIRKNRRYNILIVYRMTVLFEIFRVPPNASFDWNFAHVEKYFLNCLMLRECIFVWNRLTVFGNSVVGRCTATAERHKERLSKLWTSNKSFRENRRQQHLFQLSYWVFMLQQRAGKNWTVFFAWECFLIPEK